MPDHMARARDEGESPAHAAARSPGNCVRPAVCACALALTSICHRPCMAMAWPLALLPEASEDRMASLGGVVSACTRDKR